MKNLPRLFLHDPLAAQMPASPDEKQAHYLLHVLRLNEGDEILVFNGRDGEWCARLAVQKKKVILHLLTQTRAQEEAVPLTLFFAPIKRGHGDMAVEKASELGVSLLQPVVTQRTIVGRVPTERLQAIAVEAAEQCERLHVPKVAEPLKLSEAMAQWPADKKLFLCAEYGAATPLAEALKDGRPDGLLIGPEGGFTEDEMNTLRAKKGIIPVSLGPRVLRADTAAIAALAVIQALAGDWQHNNRR